jgi:uncharacterized protein with von Willebrand factor type A (vWA) domain
MSALLPNLLRFTRLLGQLGLDVRAGRTVDVVDAVTRVGVEQKQDFYHALRCLLVHRPQDLPVFDEAFRVFWRRPPGDRTTTDLRALGEKRRTGQPTVESPASEDGDATDGTSKSPPTIEIEEVAPLTYSTQDALRAKDFAQFTDEEMGQARRMMAALQWDMGTRRTRRWRSGRGPVADLRRLVRVNLRRGDELIDIPTRRRHEKRRPLVLLCDVSGSMERYTRMLLHFLHSVAGRADRTEVFLFATRLSRITRDLQRRAVDEVVPRIPGRIPDFAGGTRIGETLSKFNRQWSRRVLGHGAVVLLISDGWDRGDPQVLATEMARLQRTAYRVIWLNPLLGSPDYLPLTRGMQAALPFVDDFLPVHNLVSLEMLAEHLNRLPRRRPSRGTSHRSRLPAVGGSQPSSARA